MAADGVTPADLARELGRTPLQVRRVLRSEYGVLMPPHTRWYLTPSQVDFVKARFADRG